MKIWQLINKHEGAMETQLNQKYKPFEIYYYDLKSSYMGAEGDAEKFAESLGISTAEELYDIIPEYLELIGIRTEVQYMEEYSWYEINLLAAATDKFKSTNKEKLQKKKILDLDSLWGQPIIRIPLIISSSNDHNISSLYPENN